MDYSIELKLNSPTQGGFYIIDGDRQLAELEFNINDKILEAYHTGVRKELEGQGIAGKLFNDLIAYARNNGYKIIPSCSYVLAKFNKNEANYIDIWEK